MSPPAEFKLFPVPFAPESKYIPSWIGFNPESTATLTKILEDNHKKWHIFFNDQGFHKYDLRDLISTFFLTTVYSHSAHRAIALWSLGADSDVIQGGYDADSSFQRPAIEPPKSITATTFNDHLGDKP